MSKIGIIFCAWQSEDLLKASLTPWIEARKTRLGGHEFVIAAVSVPFEGFPQDEERDNTYAMLDRGLRDGDIDAAFLGNRAVKETEARGRALKWLVEQGVDLIWLVDSDEDYLESDILGAIRWVEANPFVTWHRLALRNYVFDTKTYLVEPFAPPRIFKVRAGAYCIHSFYDDNNVLYDGTITRDLKRDLDFASMTIPAALCRPKHWSWMSDSRGRSKAKYQALRWDPPNGAGCAFRWDETRGLVWNEEHFRLTGRPIPEVVTE